MQEVISNGCAAEKRTQKGNKADGHGLLPLGPEDDRVEFSTGQEGKNDSASAGKELYPGLIRAQRRTDQGADHQLRHGADDNLRKRRGNAQPDRKKRSNQCQSQPESCLPPDLVHLPLPKEKLLPSG